MRLTVFSWPLALGSLLALGACNGTGSAATPPPAQVADAAPQRVQSGKPPANQCNAQAAQSLVGQAFGPATLAQALAAAGADEARMLRPDSMITKEYKAGRLNVLVGDDGRVARVNCG